MRTRWSVLAILTLALCLAAGAQAGIIPVSEDESVVGQSGANNNYHANIYRGGLFTGVDMAGGQFASRFYLKFALPSYTPGTYVSSAILHGYYNDDWRATDDRTHSIFAAASDAWSETTITWNTQPGFVGPAVGVFDASANTPGSWQSWDITPLVDQEYQGDGVLSVMFKADDESLVSTNNNWEYFADKDYNRQLAFYLDTQVIPEPASLMMLGGGLLGLLVSRRKRRQ